MGGKWMSANSQKVVSAALLLIALTVSHSALAQKHGGVLKTWEFDSPASMSDPRRIDDRGGAPDDGRIQQPRPVRPARKADQPRVDRARARDQLVMERGADRIDDAAAARREMA